MRPCFTGVVLALVAAACGQTHGLPDDAGPDGSCDLDSVLSCGACDAPCMRNERCVDRACVPNAMQFSLGRSHMLVRTPDGLVRALGAPVPPGVLAEHETDALTWTVVRELAETLPAYSSWHVCVERAGTVSCFGDNSELQLGVAEPAWSRELVEPALPSPIRSLAVGPAHSCAVDANHEVYCWGSNRDEAMWADSTTMFSLPVPMGYTGTLLGLGSEYTCVVDLAGHLDCFGRGGAILWPTRMPDPTRVARVFAGGCVCPVYVDGRAACSGCPSPELTLRPDIRVDELYSELSFLESPVIDVALGAGFYALQADGGVVAWGEADRLGPHIAGDGYESGGIVGPLPVPVPPMSTLACVWELCCGVTVEQELWCWGHRDAAGGALWSSSSSEWNLGRVLVP